MSNNVNDDAIYEGNMEDDEYLDCVGLASANRLSPTVDNVVYHVTRIILHLLQMRGLYDGQPDEDANVHLKNFTKVYNPFNIANITPKSIHLRLFLFRLTEEATH